MSTINQIASVKISEVTENSKSQKISKDPNSEKVKNFGDTITDFIETVNKDLKSSSQQVTDVIQGKSENLHQAMIALEESKLSFQLMLEIRNKLLESYKEIERLQV